MKDRMELFRVIFASVLLVSIVAAVLLFCHAHREEHRALAAAMEMRARQVQHHASDALKSVYFLQALVLGARGGEIDLANVGPMLHRNKDIGNVMLAPGGIVRDVYPLKNGESLLGLDLLSAVGPGSRESGELGMLSTPRAARSTPTGDGVIGWLKVVMPQPDGTTRDWGLVAATLDFHSLATGELDALKNVGASYRIVREGPQPGQYEELCDSGFDDGRLYDVHDFFIHGMRFSIHAYTECNELTSGRLSLYALLLFVISLVISLIINAIMQYVLGLIRKSRYDALTQTFNREYGEKAIGRLLEKGQYGVFILIDIDHFKAINDAFGHQYGDVVLQNIAQTLRDSFRTNDLVCRLGGDEFFAYIPTERYADFIDAKLDYLKRVLRQAVVRDGKTRIVTCSIGVTFAPHDGTTFSMLYEHADKAMYAAKECGRDTHVQFCDL
ncbi:MAG: sensor domain-containing diguanylate cyclase [Desulfovibrionaceae bacterium]|nr:sensor domain-containing diguanylate cyclase [Desulfovibrionaceae bacterium]